MRSAQGLLRLLVCVFVVLSPLPFGSVEPWAVTVLELGSALAGAIAWVVLYRDPTRFGRWGRLVVIPLVVVVAIGIVQVVPLPADAASRVAPVTAEARGAVASHVGDIASNRGTLSIAPPETLDATLRLLAYVLIGLAAATAVSRPADLIPLSLAIVFSAVLQAAYGITEYVTGNQHIFGYAKVYFLEEATGTFINRNHFAGFLAIALPFALGLFMAYGRRMPSARSWRERIVFATRSDRIKSLFLALFTLLITAGVLLSFSRGGLLVAVTAVLVLLVAGAVPLRQWRWTVAVMLLAVVFVTAYSIRVPGERFADLEDHLPTVSGRLPIWSTAARMVPAYWPTGSGLGTFGHTFRMFRPAEVDFQSRHAHNDWLHSFTEGGFLTTAAMLSALVLALVVPTRRSRSGSPTAMVRAATTAAIVAIALYSLLDFSLRIPAVAVLCATVVGMRVSLASLPLPDDEERTGKLVYLPK